MNTKLHVIHPTTSLPSYNKTLAFYVSCLWPKNSVLKVLGRKVIATDYPVKPLLNTWAGLFKAGLRQPRVSAKFEFRYERWNSKFRLIVFAYNLIIACSGQNRENNLVKCFWTKEKKNRVKFSPGSALIGLRTTGPRMISFPTLSNNSIHYFPTLCLSWSLRKVISFQVRGALP